MFSAIVVPRAVDKEYERSKASTSIVSDIQLALP